VKSAAALTALAIVCAVAPAPPELIERVYSNRFYAALQPPLTSVSNLVGIALIDLVLVVAVAAWALLAVRDVARSPEDGWRRIIGRIGLRTVTWSAAAYLAFLALWGFNYRRVRLVDKLEFSGDRVTTGAALALATQAVEQLNAAYQPAHEHGWAAPNLIDRTLAEAFERAVRDTGGAHRVVPGRPKRSLLDWYFRRAAVSGMTDPYFLETLVASDVLPFERPMVVAHEWSHLAGIADEGEANFIAWIACVRSTPAHRYSGWLSLYQEVLPSLGRADRTALAAKVAAGPRQDLEAIRDRYLRNVNPRVSAVGWTVYDSYLKANRVEAGTASYTEVVRLVLGVRFTEPWTPARR
jgi:Protein of unknown function (DUF3810)